jgi:hypothetical protein
MQLTGGDIKFLESCHVVDQFDRVGHDPLLLGDLQQYRTGHGGLHRILAFRLKSVGRNEEQVYQSKSSLSKLGF